MGKKNYWHGYLEAGKKSSPVLRDLNLETGSDDTIYLYSLNRDRILEYQISIVESKLRELREDENELVSALNKSYTKAKKDFTPRGSLPLKQVEITPQASGEKEPDLSDLDDDDIDDDLDPDLDITVDDDD